MHKSTNWGFQLCQFEQRSQFLKREAVWKYLKPSCVLFISQQVNTPFLTCSVTSDAPRQGQQQQVSLRVDLRLWWTCQWPTSTLITSGFKRKDSNNSRFHKGQWLHPSFVYSLCMRSFLRLSWRLQGIFCQGYFWTCISAPEAIEISYTDPEDLWLLGTGWLSFSPFCLWCKLLQYCW